MNEKKTQDALLEAIDIMIDNKLKKLKFNYYVDGVIKSSTVSNGTNVYSVVINGETYEKVLAKNNALYFVGDAVQVLIKNGDWNKKFIDDSTTHKTSPHDLLNIGNRILIPNNSNFNNYVHIGCFAVPANDSTSTIANIPSQNAGVLDVFDSTGYTSNDNSGNRYRYRVQRYTTYKGEVFHRDCWINSSLTNWEFGRWSQSLTTLNTDFIVSQGTKDGWRYRQWSSGYQELWKCIAYQPTTTGSIVWTEAYPFRFTAQPVIQVSDGGNATVYSRLRVGNGGASVPNITTELNITWEGVNTTAYYVYANIYVYGKYVWD